MSERAFDLTKIGDSSFAGDRPQPVLQTDLTFFHRPDLTAAAECLLDLFLAIV